MSEGRPFYKCANGHGWEDASDVVAPLANIKCPHCGRTAVYTVMPVRKLEAEIGPQWPFGRATDV